MVLSACNRVEIYGRANESVVPALVSFLADFHRRPAGELEPFLYRLEGEPAVRHAFRVAASLDSMVLGEPQILGQVKDAFALAQACRTVGPVLHSLMSQAFAVAKIGRAPCREIRVASAALD